MNWRIFAAIGTLFSGILLTGSGDLYGEPPKDVVVGEVVSKTEDSITLNVHPCGKKELLTISPYKQVSSDNATCADGKKYIKVTVEQTSNETKDADKGASDKKSDKKHDKSEGREDKEAPNPPK